MSRFFLYIIFSSTLTICPTMLAVYCILCVFIITVQWTLTLTNLVLIYFSDDGFLTKDLKIQIFHFVSDQLCIFD